MVKMLCFMGEWIGAYHMFDESPPTIWHMDRKKFNVHGGATTIVRKGCLRDLKMPIVGFEMKVQVPMFVQNVPTSVGAILSTKILQEYNKVGVAANEMFQQHQYTNFTTILADVREGCIPLQV